MKKNIIILLLLLGKITFAREASCIDLNDEKVILKLKPKQQLALLTLRKENLVSGEVIAKRCFDKNSSSVNTQIISPKFEVQTIFSSEDTKKFSCDYNSNVASALNIEEARFKFKIAECITNSLNRSKKINFKEISILPPICTKFKFTNENSKIVQAHAQAQLETSVSNKRTISSVQNTNMPSVKLVPLKNK